MLNICLSKTFSAIFRLTKTWFRYEHALKFRRNYSRSLAASLVSSALQIADFAKRGQKALKNTQSACPHVARASAREALGTGVLNV